MHTVLFARLNCLRCAQGFCGNVNDPAPQSTTAAQPAAAEPEAVQLPTLQEAEEGSEEDDDGDEGNRLEHEILERRP